MTADRLTRRRPLPFKRFGTSITAVSFLLLFPGFFLYHFSASAGLVPRFLGGWFGPISVGVLGAFSMLLILVPWHLRGRSLLFFASFLILVSTVLGWLAAHDILGTVSQGHRVVQQQVLALAVLWLSLFMMGLYWPEDSSLFTGALVLGFLLIILVTLLNTNPESFLFNLAYADTARENVTTYQGFARSLAITAIVLLSSRAGSRLLLPATFATCVTLFVIGARSELYGFLVVSPIIAWFGYESRQRLTVLVAAAGVVATTALVATNWSALTDTRPLQVLGGLQEIGSFQQRQLFMLAGLQDIGANPLTGSYAGHWQHFGSSGAYIHNILSAWRQYGVGIFLLYSGLTISSSAVALRNLLKTKTSSEIWRIALVYNVFATVLVVASKPVFWPFPALGWGLVASGLLRSRV